MSDSKEEQLPWDIGWVRSMLPHRYPFLLVDRVLEMEPEKRIVALKNVTINEEFFNGHFPDHPVMPGVLIIEGLAQAGGILMLANNPKPDSKLLYFAGIDKARFRRPVVPGDQLRYEVEILRLRPTFCKIDGKAYVGDKLCAEGILSCGVVDR